MATTEGETPAMDTTTPYARLRGLREEPTVHFVLLAGALFLASAIARRDDARVIEVDPAEVDARVSEIESASGVALGEVQRQEVLDAYIDEQVLVREALALGLEDDARIHDFLAQKMLHVLSADVIQPTEAELERYYAANRDTYVVEATATADEVVFDLSGPLPDALRDQLRDGVPPERLATGVPRHHSVLTGVTQEGLAGIFGAELAMAAFRAEPGEWVGPYRSVRGEHWLRVQNRTEAVSPPLDAVRARVRLDWIVEEEAARLDRRVRELRAGYRIVFTDGEGGS